MSDKLRDAAQTALSAMSVVRVFVTSKEKIKHPEGTDWYDNIISNLEAAIAAAEKAFAQPAPVQVNWNKPELNKLRHSDHCRYWNDGEFCTCGALEYEEIKFWKNKVLAQQAEALEAALAEPTVQKSLTVAVQERMHPEIKKMYEDYFDKCFRESSAQQRQWVGLTDEEIDKAWRSLDYTVPWAQHRIDIARAIEAKLWEKNT